jgi:hypothetical protein
VGSLSRPEELRPVRLAYQPPASSTFLSEQIRHHQPTNNTFLSEQISTSHQPPAKRTGCKPGRAEIVFYKYIALLQQTKEEEKKQILGIFLKRQILHCNFFTVQIH